MDPIAAEVEWEMAGLELRQLVDLLDGTEAGVTALGNSIAGMGDGDRAALLFAAVLLIERHKAAF